VHAFTAACKAAAFANGDWHAPSRAAPKATIATPAIAHPRARRARTLTTIPRHSRVRCFAIDARWRPTARARSRPFGGNICARARRMGKHCARTRHRSRDRVSKRIWANTVRGRDVGCALVARVWVVGVISRRPRTTTSSSRDASDAPRAARGGSRRRSSRRWRRTSFRVDRKTRRRAREGR